MAIWGTIAKVATIVWSVLEKLTPIMDLLGQLIPSMQDELQTVSDIVEEGGEVADDFIDANRASFLLVREFAEKLELSGSNLKATIDALLAAADDETVTTDELAGVYTLLQETVASIANAGSAAHMASGAMKGLDSD